MARWPVYCDTVAKAYTTISSAFPEQCKIQTYSALLYPLTHPPLPAMEVSAKDYLSLIGVYLIFISRSSTHAIPSL